jgi:Apea-like HEPN
MMWSPMTAGTGSPRYSIYCPIFFHDIHRLDGFEVAGGPSEFELLGRVATLEREPSTGYAFLRVRSWPTEDEANEAYLELCAGVAQAIAVGRIACSVCGPLQLIDRGTDEFRNNLGEQAYRGWPERAPPSDGIIWPYNACILPEHERIVCHPMTWGQEIRIITPNVLSGCIGDANRRFPAMPSLPERVRLALSLVAQANAQREPSVELVNLVYALEAIALESDNHPSIVQLISTWSTACRARTVEEKTKDSKDSELIRRLEILHSSLGHLKKESITSSIIRLASDSPDLNLPAPNFRKPDNLPKAIKQLYAVRSSFVHPRPPEDESVSRLALINEHLPVARYIAASALSFVLRRASEGNEAGRFDAA